MKQLTKAEEQIMQVIWNRERPFLREILSDLPNPKPHQNTVSTVLRVLMDKGFLEAENFGRMHRYVPLVSREAYTKASLMLITKNYFNGSFRNVVSFMMDQKDIDLEELELFLKEAKKNRKK